MSEKPVESLEVLWNPFIELEEFERMRRDAERHALVGSLLAEGYSELARWSDQYHQENGPIMAKPNDNGSIFDPDLPSAAWLTEQREIPWETRMADQLEGTKAGEACW